MVRKNARKTSTKRKEKTLKVTQITYSRTKQVSRYEPERIEMTVTLGPKDTVESAVQHCRQVVAEQFKKREEDKVQCTCGYGVSNCKMHPHRYGNDYPLPW
jgi:hypothetical protein